MTDDSLSVIPAPENRQRPSLADLVTALADTFEDEAAHFPPTLAGSAAAQELRMCAIRVREAIAKGAQT